MTDKRKPVRKLTRRIPGPFQRQKASKLMSCKKSKIKTLTSTATTVRDVCLSMAAVATVIVLGSLTQEARAQDVRAQKTPSLVVSANGGVTTDYLFRGVTQSDRDPAVFAGVDLNFGKTYAGVWASQVKFAGDEETRSEVDLYAGFKPVLAEWVLDLGVIGYLYPNAPSGADYDYWELKAAASRDIGKVRVGASAFYSPDFFGNSEDEALYVQIDAAMPVRPDLTLSGALGHQSVSSQLDYTTWNVGATWQMNQQVSVDLRYADTDQQSFGRAYQEALVLTLKAGF